MNRRRQQRHQGQKINHYRSTHFRNIAISTSIKLTKHPKNYVKSWGASFFKPSAHFLPRTIVWYTKGLSKIGKNRKKWWMGTTCVIGKYFFFPALLHICLILQNYKRIMLVISLKNVFCEFHPIWWRTKKPLMETLFY